MEIEGALSWGRVCRTPQIKAACGHHPPVSSPPCVNPCPCEPTSPPEMKRYHPGTKRRPGPGAIPPPLPSSVPRGRWCSVTKVFLFAVVSLAFFTTASRFAYLRQQLDDLHTPTVQGSEVAPPVALKQEGLPPSPPQSAPPPPLPPLLRTLATSGPPMEVNTNALTASLPGETFNLLLIERTDTSVRSSERLCVGPACQGQRFFYVDQKRPSSDNVLTFLLNQELRIIEAFVTILSSSDCTSILNGGKTTPWCAQARGQALPRSPPLVLDVGSNAGFFSLLSASQGARVVAVDPQPHCLAYVSVAAAAGGVSHMVSTLNAYASPSSSQAPKDPSPVPTRSGCWGMWPHDVALSGEPMEHRDTRAEYDALPGGNSSTLVPYIPLESIIRGAVAESVAAAKAAAAAVGGSSSVEAAGAAAAAEGVLVMKIDAEGSEGKLVGHLRDSGVLREGLVKNYFIELNKHATTLEGGACLDASKPSPYGAWRCMVELLESFREAGYTILVHEPWKGPPIDNITDFAIFPWHTADVWLALPRGE